MKFKDVLPFSGGAIGTIFTALQTNEVFQIISLVITILSTLIATAFTIWKWWKKASEDGKITSEELDDLNKDVTDILGKKGEEKEDGKKD